MLDIMREYYEKSEEGRAYLAYYDVTGGGEIGYMQPTGYPDGVEQMGGPTAVYRECVKRGITWEELLRFKDTSPDDAII